MILLISPSKAFTWLCGDLPSPPRSPSLYKYRKKKKEIKIKDRLSLRYLMFFCHEKEHGKEKGEWEGERLRPRSFGC